MPGESTEAVARPSKGIPDACMLGDRRRIRREDGRAANVASVVALSRETPRDMLVRDGMQGGGTGPLHHEAWGGDRCRSDLSATSPSARSVVGPKWSGPRSPGDITRPTLDMTPKSSFALPTDVFSVVPSCKGMKKKPSGANRFFRHPIEFVSVSMCIKYS